MKTITAPNKSGELLQAGQVLNVSGYASIELIDISGNKLGPIKVLGSQVIGPFNNNVQLVIAALEGAVNYELTAYSKSTPLHLLQPDLSGSTLNDVYKTCGVVTNTATLSSLGITTNTSRVAAKFGVPNGPLRGNLLGAWQGLYGSTLQVPFSPLTNTGNTLRRYITEFSFSFDGFNTPQSAPNSQSLFVGLIGLPTSLIGAAVTTLDNLVNFIGVTSNLTNNLKIMHNDAAGGAATTIELPNVLMPYASANNALYFHTTFGLIVDTASRPGYIRIKLFIRGSENDLSLFSGDVLFDAYVNVNVPSNVALSPVMAVYSGAELGGLHMQYIKTWYYENF